jgi:catechol 2,3-dioxygenase-like lactoylglutathione lyase family enzyme
MGRRMPVIHHVGYVVEDLQGGIERFAREFGAGPFSVMEHIAFDEVTFEGTPAVYDHSSAFGRWGPIIIEITQVHDAQPQGLRDALTQPGGGIGHVAWLADDLEAETARLETAGLHAFHTGRTGPVSAAWFDGGGLFGHPVEVLQRCDELLGFYEQVRASAAIAAHDAGARGASNLHTRM